MNKLKEIRYSIPDALHKALKLRAVEEEKTLKDLIIEFLEKGIENTRSGDG